MQSKVVFIVFFFYGSSDKQKRRKLLEGLSSAIHSRDTPWSAIGDFNATLSFSEKRGGQRARIGCPFFEEFLELNNF